MLEIGIRLEPSQPLRFGSVRAGSEYLNTERFIPGGVLRGALAEWMLLRGKESEIEDVIRGIRFGNLRPCEDSSLPSFPLPLTAIECKLHPGFSDARGMQKGHGIRDTALLRLCWKLLEGKARAPIPLTFRCWEENCGGRAVQAEGFVVEGSQGWEKVSVPTALQTKVALSRSRRASQEGMLYRVVAIPPGLSFVGRLWVRDRNLFDLVQAAVEACGVGGQCTRGFGAAALSEVSCRLPAIPDRISRFNEALKNVWKDLAPLFGVAEAAPDKLHFSVDLVAPGIFEDPHGLGSLVPQLRKEAVPVLTLTRPAFAGGWSTAWGLPKPTALAAAAGSVYVFRWEGRKDELVAYAMELEERGIGDRTGEGYGEILVCHPFHLKTEPV